MAEPKYYFLAPIEQTRRGGMVDALVIQPIAPISINEAITSYEIYSNQLTYHNKDRQKEVLGVVRLPANMLPVNSFGMLPTVAIQPSSLGSWRATYIGPSYIGDRVDLFDRRLKTITQQPSLYYTLDSAKTAYFGPSTIIGPASSTSAPTPTVEAPPKPVPVAPVSGMAFDDIFKSEVPVATMIPAFQDPRVQAISIEKAESSYTQIGYTCFQIPPNAITVNVEHGLQAVEMMRTNSAVKQLDAKVVTQVGLTFTVAGPDDYAAVVQGLLEQFRRCPFLPVYNSMLNSGHEIDALALTSMGVSTTQGYPGVFEVSLNAQPFDWRNYIPNAEDYDQLFCWPLFQMWCKSRAADSFKPLPSSLSGDFKLQIPNLDMLEAQQEMGKTILDTNPIGAALDNLNLNKIPNMLDTYHSKSRAPGQGVLSENLRIFHDSGGQAMVGIKVYSKVANLFLLLEASKAKPDVRVATVKSNDKLDAGTCVVQSITEKTIAERDEYITSLQSPASKEGLGHIWPLAQFVEYIFPASSDIINKLRAQVTIGFTTPSTQVIGWEDFNLGDVMVIESINTQIGNNIATVHPRTAPGELHQFMGGSDAAISLIGYVFGTDNLREITEAIRQLEGIAKRFRARAWGMDVAGYFKVENEILNSQGIEAIIPLSITSQIVEGYPELYSVKMDFIQFKETQRRQEASTYLNKSLLDWFKTSEGLSLLKAVVDDANKDGATNLDVDKIINAHDVSDLVKITRLNSPRARWAMSVIQKLIVQQLEVYPDLDLPTKGEYNDWVDQIQSFVKDPEKYAGPNKQILNIITDNGRAMQDFPAYKPAIEKLRKYSSRFGYCDPDFFIACNDPEGVPTEYEYLSKYLEMASDPAVPVGVVPIRDRFGGITMCQVDKLPQEQSDYDAPGDYSAALLQASKLDAVIEAGSTLETEGFTPPSAAPFTQSSNPRYDQNYAALFPSPFDIDYIERGQKFPQWKDKAKTIQKLLDDPAFRKEFVESLRIVNTNLMAASLAEFPVPPDQRIMLDYGTALAQIVLESSGYPLAENPSTKAYGVYQFKPGTWKGSVPNKLIQYLAGGTKNLPMTSEERSDRRKSLIHGAAYLCVKLNDAENNGLPKHPAVTMAAHLGTARALAADKRFKASHTIAAFCNDPKAENALGLRLKVELGMALASHANAIFNGQEILAGTGASTEAITRISEQTSSGMVITRYVTVVDVLEARLHQVVKPNSPSGTDWTETYFTKGVVKTGFAEGMASWKAKYPALDLGQEAGGRIAWSYRIRLYKQELVDGEIPTSLTADKQYHIFEANESSRPRYWKFVGEPTAMTEFPVATQLGTLRTGPDGEPIDSIPNSGGTWPTEPTTMVGVYVSYTPPKTTSVAPGGGIKDHPPVDTKFKDMLVDLQSKHEFGRLLRAYPGYIVMVIDGGRWIGRELLWPHFYGEFGIQAITVTATREDPTDVAEVAFSNLYNRLTSQTAYNTLLNRMDTRRNWSGPAIQAGLEQFRAIVPWIGSGEATKGTKDRWEKFAQTMLLKPGARLHIRWGYGSNPNDLPVAFNGTISEVPVTDTVAIVTALGDGAELSRAIPLTDDYIKTGVSGQREWFNSGATWTPKEPKDIIADLFQPSNWLISNISMRFFSSDNKYGICNFGTGDFKSINIPPPAREPGNAFGYTHGDTMVNVFTSDTASLNRGYGHWYWLLAGMVAHLNGAHFLGVSVADPTPWKIISTCRLGVPDYVCAARPFEFRSTLFYGRQDYPFCHRYTMSAEPLKQVVGAPVKMRSIIPPGMNPGETISSEAQERLGMGQPIDKNFQYSASNDPSLNGPHGAKYHMLMDKKTFAQFHIIASDYNLLSNYVKASDERVFTNCQAKYSWGGMPIVGNSMIKEGDLMQADSDIFPEIQKTKIISTGIYSSEFHGAEGFQGIVQGITWGYYKPVAAAANCAAVQTLKDDIGQMYQGAFLLTGDPFMRPWDLAMIFDHGSRMNGVVQLRSTTSSMTLENGFITAVEPDCLVLATNDVLSQWVMSAGRVCSSFIGGMLLRKMAAGVATNMGNQLLSTTHTILDWDGKPASGYKVIAGEGGDLAIKNSLAGANAEAQQEIVNAQGKLRAAQHQLRVGERDFKVLIDTGGDDAVKANAKQVLDALKAEVANADEALRSAEKVADDLKGTGKLFAEGKLGGSLSKISQLFKGLKNTLITKTAQNIDVAAAGNWKVGAFWHPLKWATQGTTRLAGWTIKGLAGTGAAGVRSIIPIRIDELVAGKSTVVMSDGAIAEVTKVVREGSQATSVEVKVTIAGEKTALGQISTLARGEGWTASQGLRRVQDATSVMADIRASLPQLKLADKTAKLAMKAEEVAFKATGLKEETEALIKARQVFKAAQTELRVAKGISAGITAVKFASNIIPTIVLGCVGDWMTRKLAARQCVVIFPLTVNGLEFSAGINGHMGSVYGDKPSIEDMALAAFFNPIEHYGEAPFGGLTLPIIGGLLNLAVPWDGAAFDPQRWKTFGDSPSGLAPTPGVMDKIAKTNKTQDAFEDYIKEMVAKAKMRQKNQNITTDIDFNNTTTTSALTPGAVTTAANEVLSKGYSYRYSGSGTDGTIDCSHFVDSVLKTLKAQGLTRQYDGNYSSTASMYSKYSPVALPPDTEAKIQMILSLPPGAVLLKKGHTGIYLGDGWLAHATGTRSNVMTPDGQRSATGVGISSVRKVNYWTDYWIP